MANQYDTNLKLQAIADAIGNSQSSGLISALEDIADAVAGGGGGGSAAAGLVSDNFSETDTYDLGDYCIHNNTLYVCINAITTPGAWDLSDWQATNAGIELSSLNSALEYTDISNDVSFGLSGISNASKVIYKQGKRVTITARAMVALANNLTILSGLPSPTQAINLAFLTGAGVSLFTLTTAGTLVLTSPGASGTQYTGINFDYISI